VSSCPAEHCHLRDAEYSQSLNVNRKTIYFSGSVLLANVEGGALQVGYDDRGQAVGVEHAAKLLEDMPKKVRNVLGIVVDVNLELQASLQTLYLQVAAYPYSVSYKSVYQHSSGSTKQELKGAALDRFLLKNQGLHYDDMPHP
jgi:ATP-dependent DNA helicase RecG